MVRGGGARTRLRRTVCNLSWERSTYFGAEYCLTLLLSVADLVGAESRIASGCFAFLQQTQAAAAAMSDDWDEGETTTSVSGSARPAVCAFCTLFRGFLVVLFAAV